MRRAALAHKSPFHTAASANHPSTYLHRSPPKYLSLLKSSRCCADTIILSGMNDTQIYRSHIHSSDMIFKSTTQSEPWSFDYTNSGCYGNVNNGIRGYRVSPKFCETPRASYLGMAQPRHRRLGGYFDLQPQLCLQIIGLNPQPCNANIFIRQNLFQIYLSNDGIIFPAQAPIGRKVPGSAMVQFLRVP